jgi:uncharacterized protein (TIGR02246 family)
MCKKWGDLMLRISSVSLLLALVAVPVLADATADARKHSEAFARAYMARDRQAILALYADNARCVWPGQGEEARGKAAIGKLVDGFLQAFPTGTLAVKSVDAMSLGNGYIATVGHWEQTFTGPDGKVQSVELRSTEVLRKRNGKTLYVIDHASIGLPPPPGNP